MRKIIALIIAITLVGAIGWKVWRTDSNSDTPIRIAINPWPGYEFLYLAEQKGYLADEGLNIRLLQYSSLEDVKAAFEHGHADGMTTTVAEIIQANVRGKRRAQAVLVADFSNGADVILAKKSITSVSQLKGKKIAAEKASLGMFLLARALEKAGMSLDDVQVLAYDQPSMHQAIDKSEIDAAVTYPPFSIEMSKHDGLQKIFDSAALPGEILDTLSFDSELLRRRPEIATAIIRAWGKVLAYAKAHPEDANRIMARRENISVSEFTENLNGLHIVSMEEQAELLKPGGKLEQSIVFMSKILHRSGELEKPVDTPGGYVFRAKENK